MNNWVLSSGEADELDSSPLITFQSVYIKEDDVITLILWIFKNY